MILKCEITIIVEKLLLIFWAKLWFDCLEIVVYRVGLKKNPDLAKQYGVVGNVNGNAEGKINTLTPSY